MTTTSIIAQIAEWMGVIAVALLLALAPRFKRTVIGFKYARRDGLTAVTLVFTVLAFSFLFSATGIGGTLTALVPVSGLSAPLAGPLALALFSLLPIIGALILRAQPLRSAGWPRELLMPALQLGLALALLTIFLRNRVMDMLSGLSTPELGYLAAALIIAVAEETIFRGYIQMRLGWWLGEWRGLIATALAYAAWRLPGLMNGNDTTAILIGLALAFGQGLVTGFLMTRCKHVLAPSMYRAISIWLNLFV